MSTLKNNKKNNKIKYCIKIINYYNAVGIEFNAWGKTKYFGSSKYQLHWEDLSK